MNRLRYALIAGICVVCYLLFLQWNKFEARQLAERQSNEAAETTVATVVSSDIPETITSPETELLPSPAPAQSEDLPTVADTSVSLPTPALEPATPSQRLIDVTTDKFHLLIDSFGGDIVRVELQEHLANRKESAGMVLMNRSSNSTYVAQSGLIGTNGTDKSSILSLLT